MTTRSAGKNVIRQADGDHVITVYNRGRQTVHLQVKPPGGDFFLHEQVIYLKPGKSVQIPKNCANSAQIRNLQAKRQIQVTNDTETQPKAPQPPHQAEQLEQSDVAIQQSTPQSAQQVADVVVTQVSREQEPELRLPAKKKRR